MLYGPARPDTRPPPIMGTGVPSDKPIRRLKNRTGVSPGGVPENRGPAPPNEKRSCPSKKNCRFSGKYIPNRVRFIIASSTSTCAKSVLYVKSATNPLVSPYFKSKPPVRVNSLSIAGLTVVSDFKSAIPYGLNSRLIERRGASTPTSVAEDENFQIPTRP